MRYISIDTETTSLDPRCGQILEFGAVIDDLTKPKDQYRPRFHVYLKWDSVIGNPYAMWMNRDILEIIAKDLKPNVISPDKLGPSFVEWLDEHELTTKVPVAGKNFGSFDLQFLKMHDGMSDAIKRFDHRFIDPGSMFISADDANVPGLPTCLLRSNKPNEVKHTAVEDALQVIEVIRFSILGE